MAECVNSQGDDVAKLLAPMPYAKASEDYAKAFAKIMGLMSNDQVGNHTGVSNSMLDAQSLWDATMAHSIHLALKEKLVVMHLAGYFHVQKGLGILEHLRQYRDLDDLSILSVVILPEEEPHVFRTESHRSLADLVVLTDLDSIDP